MISLLIVLSCVNLVLSSSDYLYYYGDPLKTSATGFIKLDPSSSSWEPAAQGFPTIDLSAISSFNGFIATQNGPSLLFGGFTTWNATYVGCYLELDTKTMTPKIFNTGVLGDQIIAMTYINNASQIALLGYFTGFQSKPAIEVNNIGYCSIDGKSCSSLGSGFPQFYANGKTLSESAGSYLFVLYDQGNETIIEVFDTSNTTQDWQVIYQNIGTPSALISMCVYQNELWIFGQVDTTGGNQNSSAAKWNSSSFSWEYLVTYPQFQFYDYDSVDVYVSPDGNSAWMTCGTLFDSTMFQYDGVNSSWISLGSLSCSRPIIDATNEGLLIGCSEVEYYGNVLAFPQGYNLSGLSCLSGRENCNWLDFEVSSDSATLYAFTDTDEGILRTISYDLVNQKILVDTLLDGLQAIADVIGLSVYGDKMMLTGSFNQVDRTYANQISIWDNSYQKWYQVIDLSLPLMDCFSDSDGQTAMAVCTYYGDWYATDPIIIVDNASSDPGVGNLAQNVQLYYNVSGFPKNPSFSQVKVKNGTFFMTVQSTMLSNIHFCKWTATEGLISIASLDGYDALFDIVDDMVYFVGAGQDHFSNAVRYNLSDNTFLPMDQISMNGTDNVYLFDISYWPDTNQVYVSGIFDRIGSMRVADWGGYNLDGTASDPVAGGIQSTVSALQPVGSKMFIAEDPTDCQYCSDLLSFDYATQSYSAIIIQGVKLITAGSSTHPAASSSSSSDSSSAWKIALITCAVVFASLAICSIVFLVYRRRTSKKRNYEEIPDYLHPANNVPIDFQKDEFVLKSVLGRGAYGTVWSCVFPNSKGATFAVKQMLFSKGETSKIEVVQKEIDILEKFRHPHIVHYCGHRMATTQTSVEFFIFMELYEQPCSLKGVIQKRQKQLTKNKQPIYFTYEEVKMFLLQIADGLHYLHLNMVAHRDLKCANILVRTKEGMVTSLHIADFGISRVMAQEGKVLASTILGTPSFMAPEILSGQKYDAFKADIWSFGITLYEMLTWQEPQNPGTKPQIPENVLEFMKCDSRFDQFLEILDKCTQHEPSARPTASDLLFLCENLS